jgi:hypothetical protein
VVKINDKETDNISTLELFQGGDFLDNLVKFIIDREEKSGSIRRFENNVFASRHIGDKIDIMPPGKEVSDDAPSYPHNGKKLKWDPSLNRDQVKEYIEFELKIEPKR